MSKLFRVITLVFCSHLATTNLYSQNEFVVESISKDGKVITERKIVNANSNSTFGSVITRDGKIHYLDSNEDNYLSENDSVLDIIVEFKEEPLFIKQSRNENLKSTTHSTQALTPFYEKRFREFENELRSTSTLKSTSANPKIKRKYHKIFFGANVEIPGEMLNDIKKLPYVKKVTKNGIVKTSLTESVPLIRADKVWTDLGTQGDGITVGILDTGIDYKHPALGGNESSTFPTEKIIGGYDFINEDNDPMDDHFHGTHCAGIVAADNEIIKGVAPKASLYAYKVLDANGSGPDDLIIAAIEMTVDPNGDGDYSDKLDIVNMSLGGSGDPDDAMSTAVDNAVALGVTFCIAAGNNYNYNTIGSPGTARKAITVGSTTKSDQISNFSSRGPNNKIYTTKPEIVAPGSDIYSSFPINRTSQMTSKGYSANYESISGTSMATPHVAGVCALIKKLHPNWTPEQIKSAVMTTAINLGEDAMTQGAGRVDAYSAASVTSFVFPSKLDFGFNYGDEENWSVIKTITVTNHNDNTQTYTITTNDLIAGIEIITSSSEFTLNSGESQEIIITVNANNNILDYSEKESMAYDGVIDITGTTDTLNIPWAFIKTSLLVLSFDKPNPYFYVANKENYKGFYDASWNENKNEATLLLPRDNYDMIFDFWNRDYNPNSIVIREKIFVDKITQLSINSTEAIHKIQLNSIDEHGQSLSNLPYTFKRHNFQFLFPDSSNLIAVGVYTPWESNQTIYCSPLSENFSLLAGELLFDLNENRKLYIPQYDLIKGLDRNLELTNNISEYIHQSLKIKTKPKASKATFWIFSEFYYQIISGFVYSGRGNGFVLDTNSWDADIFLTPMKHEKLGFTANLSVSEVEIEGVSSKWPWLKTERFSVYQDSLAGIFKSNIPHSNVYLSPGDEDINLGSGPIYTDAFFANNYYGNSSIMVNPTFYGQLNEKRPSDIDSTLFSIFDKDDTLVITDLIVNNTTLNLDAKVYRARVINENYYVNNEQGKSTLISTFDLSNSDAIPPGLSSLQIRDSKGVPVDKIKTGDDAVIRFSSKDYRLANNYVYYKTIESDSTKLYLKEQNSGIWQKIELDKLHEDIALWYDQIGWVYSADIANFTNYDSTYLDLKIVVQDEAGNSMEWILEPAVFVGLPENTPENDPPLLYSISDTSIRYNDTLSLLIRSYDPDGDSLSFSSYSNNINIKTIINDSVLNIFGELSRQDSAIIKIIVTDGEFSDSTEFVVTAVNSKPIISNIADTTMPMNGSTIIALKAYDPNGDSLSFSSSSDDNNAVNLIRDSTLFLFPVQGWTGVSNIQVKVTDGELFDTANFVLTVENITGIDDPISQSNDGIIKIFPNPSNSGLFYLETSLDKIADIRIEAFNLSGLLVYQKEIQKSMFNNQIINIDLSNQVKGTYFLRVFIDEQIIQEKVIIQ